MKNESQVVQQPNEAGRQQAQQDQRKPAERAMLPPIDVIEDGAGITMLADLPGVAKEGLSVEVEPDGLTIEGVLQPIASAELKAQFAEVRIPRFRRSFTLSKELDTEKIEAELQHGVLRIRIPKLAGARPRRIAVNVA